LTISSRLRANRLFLFLTVFAVFSVAGILPARAKENKRYASIVLDAETGVILSQSNADKPLHPASLTKIMTLLMAFEAMEQGKLSARDRIRVSKHAASHGARASSGSSPAPRSKSRTRFTPSSPNRRTTWPWRWPNELGGTETNFARMMTNRARQLGMANTTFTNASGLHDPRQYSSARDMATLARFVINTYPILLPLFLDRELQLPGPLLSQPQQADGNLQGHGRDEDRLCRPLGFQSCRLRRP
jgi:D-alanyl-D-alanine carboxypeptidase